MKKLILSILLSAIVICTPVPSASAAIISDNSHIGKFMVEADSSAISCKNTNIKRTSDASMAFVSYGTELTIIADAKSGYYLSGWEITEYANGSIETTPYTADSNSIIVTVYDKNLKIHPVYQPRTSTITFRDVSLVSKITDFKRVGNSKIAVNASLGDIIKVKALTKTGYEVCKWEITLIEENSDGTMMLTDFYTYPDSETLELKVSSFNYEVTPIYAKKQYELYIDGFLTEAKDMELRTGTEGGWCMTDWGKTIELTAKIPDGKRFKEWSIDGVKLPDITLKSNPLSFEMPLSDVKVTAVYIDEPSPANLPDAAALSADYGSAAQITALIILLILAVFIICLAIKSRRSVELPH